MDIDMVRLENAKDLLAVKGIVNDIVVQVLADSCANISFIQKDLANELELDIDNSKIQRINGASGSEDKKTLGVARNVLIQLGDSGCIIKEDLAVIDYPYREIGLSRTCLRRYNYDIHESRDHIAFTCEEKNYFIPIVPDQNRGI